MSRARILIVDDSDLNREFMAQGLEEFDFEVAEAEDGREVLSLLEEQAFDVILLDIVMPGMSGLEILEAVRRTHPPSRLSIIMLSSLEESETVVEAFRLGADDYVTKPIDFAVTVARIETQLARRPT